tara:strand:- start:289 stop:576 length:288 start_codon:yes stop_codon:yes gene_type:complete
MKWYYFLIAGILLFLLGLEYDPPNEPQPFAQKEIVVKKIKTITSKSKRYNVVVYWNAEWQEYVVKLYVDGQEQKAASYHTSDREDAIGTAEEMVK